MNDNDVLFTSIIIILVLIVVGGNLGLSLSGEIEKPDLDNKPPGLLGVLDWCWNGVAFFFGMLAFSVPGVPAWLSAIFLLMTLGIVWILLKWVRGSAS